jgi:hypothetical protein
VINVRATVILRQWGAARITHVLLSTAHVKKSSVRASSDTIYHTARCLNPCSVPIPVYCWLSHSTYTIYLSTIVELPIVCIYTDGNRPMAVQIVENGLRVVVSSVPIRVNLASRNCLLTTLSKVARSCGYNWVVCQGLSTILLSKFPTLVSFRIEQERKMLYENKLDMSVAAHILDISSSITASGEAISILLR